MARRKLEELKRVLMTLDSVCVAFSGGVDSTLLLKVARDVMGERVMAVTAKSPTYPEQEFQEARATAVTLGARHLVLDSNELDIPGFSENPPDRCYLCKGDLFRKLREIAKNNGVDVVADGSNADDAGDYRPGRQAAEELGVRSPLAEVGLTKAEIRSLSRQLGLPTWNKPSLACLSSRIPYGQEITMERLKSVENAEAVLRRMGFTQVRVRWHGQIARLELVPDEMTRLTDTTVREAVCCAFRELGFTYVTLDLAGYRTGSMNEVLAS